MTLRRKMGDAFPSVPLLLEKTEKGKESKSSATSCAGTIKEGASLRGVVTAVLEVARLKGQPWRVFRVAIIPDFGSALQQCDFID